MNRGASVLMNVVIFRGLPTRTWIKLRERLIIVVLVWSSTFSTLLLLTFSTTTFLLPLLCFDFYLLRFCSSLSLSLGLLSIFLGSSFFFRSFSRICCLTLSLLFLRSQLFRLTSLILLLTFPFLGFLLCRCCFFNSSLLPIN